ncbi:GATA zinc finger domain-containing protein [Ditylenchus destructor]|uniref:GATA zinc finger domain-containing protein n=1 Tax=Ditylenchus destructor TaxID=166010 RepID=A0AAD4NCJ7_9BILA|nr:GATA zinc finger domain-containing protein [Ditylenchus destructor]
MPRATNIEENHVSRKKRSSALELVDVPTRASAAESSIVTENPHPPDDTDYYLQDYSQLVPVRLRTIPSETAHVKMNRFHHDGYEIVNIIDAAESSIVTENPHPPDDTDYYLPFVQDYSQLIPVRLHTIPPETAHVKVNRFHHDGYEIVNITDDTPIDEEIYADVRPLPQIVYNGVTYCPMMFQSLQFYQESIPNYDQFPESEKNENGAADHFLEPLDPASIDIFGVNQDVQVQSPSEINRIKRSNKKKCINCKTDNTSMWRRNDEGCTECNACQLYHQKNGVARPPQLFNDKIKKRRSRPRYHYQ